MWHRKLLSAFCCLAMSSAPKELKLHGPTEKRVRASFIRIVQATYDDRFVLA